MTPAALLAIAALALPEGAARYRVELGDEVVGVASFGISCDGDGCLAVYQSRLRLPAEAGGGQQSEKVEVEVDRDGKYRGGRLSVIRNGGLHPARGRAGAVPSALAELVLVDVAGSRERCLDTFTEAPFAPTRACGKLEGEVLVGTVEGLRTRIVPGRDGYPLDVLVEGRFRYVRDAAAKLPDAPPRLFGIAVPGPAATEAARSFCGTPRDPPVTAGPPPRAPPPRASGANCREKAADWLAAAAKAGLPGRTAVGVAFDGTRFAWHAWAEVKSGEAWVPVDPTFGESPARGPRFTLGRWADGDEAARAEAGRRVLACWGQARVE